jgi:serine/threonine-protein kinase
VPLRDLVPETHPELEAVVMKALAKNSSDRWSDCAEMQRALEHVNSMMGMSVTDGDVAKFVRETMGHLFEDRNRKLAEAIRRADNLLAPEPVRKVPAVNRAIRGGAPLPATFQGILPVALDDGSGHDHDAAPPPLAPLPAAPLPSAHPPVVVAPPRPRKRRSPLLFVFLLLIAALGAGAFLVKTGRLPWVAQRLPPWLSILAPPR